MKNFIIALIVACSCLMTNSYAGECANGSCLLNKVARKTVSVSRSVVRVPVIVSKNVVVATRDVLKNQPIRNRILNRSRTVVNQ